METQSTNNSGFKSRSASRTHMALLALCEGAIMVALAQVLSYLKLYEFPQGGSITIGMFPIFLYCARWGFGPGMLASVAYSLLQLFLDGAYAWGWQSMLGDYIIAFSVLGVAGLFYRKKRRLLPGHSGWLPGPFPGSLPGRRHHLGQLYAGIFLRHDHDQSLVLLGFV